METPERTGLNLIQTTQVVIAVLLTVAVLAAAGSVFAPLAFGLFIIALAWPVQQRLQAMLPRYAALALSFLLVVVTFVALGWLIAWAFGQVARWTIGESARFQQLYEVGRLWLEARGIVIASFWSENFGIGWLLRTMQTISGRLNSTLTFWFITLVYVLLGLMEVEEFGRRIRGLRNRTVSRVLLEGSRQTAGKIRRYMVVRTAMSVVTGTLVWIFARAVGLPLAEEWGFIAFALNYIPFVGPFVATLLPSLLALTQYETWEAVLAIFIGLNVIQSIVGSYIEPRVSGSALSMSPALVLFSVFLWAYLWGIFGAFIGVPITIAVLTFCSQHESSLWIAELFGLDSRKASDPSPS